MSKFTQLIIAALLVVCFQSSFAAEQNSVIPTKQVWFSFYTKGMNMNISRPPKPIAFQTGTKADSGFSIGYQRNYFSFLNQHILINFGLALGRWHKDQTVYSLTLYPQLQIVPFTIGDFRPFISWTVGGLTLFSNTHFDNRNISVFNFQDYVGAGFSYGPVSVALDLVHFSNADFFKEKGFDVPNMIKIGYSFS